MIIIFPEKLNTFVYLLKVIIYLFYVDLKKYSLLVTEIRRIVHNCIWIQSDLINVNFFI